MATDAIVISATGIVSPLGLNSIQTCAAIRAGIARLCECEDYHCEPATRESGGGPDPVICGRVPISAMGSSRIVRFLAAALQETLQCGRMTRSHANDSSLYLSLPFPANGFDYSRHILEQFMALTGMDFPAAKISGYGHAGVFMAVQEAILSLQQSENKFCLVAGADSFINTERLTYLDNTRRLKSNRNPDGFIPGECAAVLLLEKKSQAIARGIAALARVESTGTAREENVVGSDRPSTGQGLAQAIKAAWPGNQPVGWVICDLNGESYRAREWGYCQVRLSKIFKELRTLWHPADCLGDSGAASGALFAAVAARAMERNYAPSEKVLLWGSSDNGDRGAMVLARTAAF